MDTWIWLKKWGSCKGTLAVEKYFITEENIIIMENIRVRKIGGNRKHFCEDCKNI